MATVLAILATLLILVGFPAFLIVEICRYLRAKERPRTATGFGSALLEIDRLIARPSVVHQLEAEGQVRAIDDEQGGGDDGPEGSPKESTQMPKPSASSERNDRGQL
jgi:hypothetical protein